MKHSVKLPPIEFETYIGVPPQRVYDTLTTASGWDAWFTQGTEVDAYQGGSIRLRWQDFGPSRITEEDGGPVLEAAAAERLVFQWTPGDSTTTVEFTLVPRGPGTLVQLMESGHSTSAKDLAALVDCAAGWGEALTLLKVYLEHGITYGQVPSPEEG